jgi:hypothetical protein
MAALAVWLLLGFVEQVQVWLEEARWLVSTCCLDSERVANFLIDRHQDDEEDV